MDQLIKNLESASLIKENQKNLEKKIEQHKVILKSITELREVLYSVRRKLQRLVNYCIQYDTYKQEMILARLAAIEKQLIFNRMDKQIIFVK